MKRKDIHWVYLSTIYLLLAGAVFYLYLARVLPPTELGAVVIFQAIATVVSTSVALGLGSGFQPFLAFYRGRQEHRTLRVLVRGSLGASLVLALAGFAVTFALSGSLGALFFRSNAYEPALQLLSLYAGLSTAMTILQGVVLGFQRFAAYSVRSFVAYTATYGGAVLFLAFRPEVISIVAGWSFGAAVGCTLYVAAVLTDRSSGGAGTSKERGDLRATPTLYRSVLLYSLPVLVSSVISTSAIYVDRLVLASVSDLASVGFYNYALLFVGGSLIVTAPFATVLVPRLSEYFGRDDRSAIRAITRTSTTLLVLIYVPFALVLAALGPFLLGSLVGAAFVRDSVAMAVLLALTAAAIPVVILGSLAGGVRRTPALMKAAAVALIANAALSILLVPRVGILGAAIGNSAMYWGPLVVLSLEFRTSGFVDLDLRSLARIWVAAAAMAVTTAVPLILWGYRPLFVVLSLSLGLGVLLAALRAVRAVPEDVADQLVHILPNPLRFLLPAICWVSACEGCRHGGKAVRAAGE